MADGISYSAFSVIMGDYVCGCWKSVSEISNNLVVNRTLNPNTHPVKESLDSEKTKHIIMFGLRRKAECPNFR